MVPGFADPALGAQCAFRAILDAMSRPGMIKAIETASGHQAAAPGLLNEAAFVTALTLMDFETPVWLDSGLADDQAVVDALRFHCGCPITHEKAGASFALINSAETAPPLADFHQGTPEYPDRSATVVIQVPSLQEGGALRLQGPGIKGETRLDVGGLPSAFWQAWQANHRRYPLGVDLVLTAGHQLVALPRSIHVEA